MKYLLDSNACIHHLRLGAASSVKARLATLPAGDAGLCSVVLGELLFGALRSNNPAKNLADVRTFLGGFRSLPFDDAAADHYASIRADLTALGQLIGPNDLMIAAIAMAHSLILVTHNTAEFSRVTGLTIEDWQIP